MYRCTTESMANPSSPPIQLPHLTSLQIDLGSLDAIEDLLGHIEAPERCSLTTSLRPGEEIEGFLQRISLKWMSKWKNSALVPFEGLMFEVNRDDLRVEFSTVDRSKPFFLAIEGSGPSWVDQLCVALPQFIDALASWTKDVTILRLRLGYPPSGCRTLSFKQFIIEQFLRLPPVTSVEVSGVQINSLLHGLRLGDVSSLFLNIRTVSFFTIHAYELRECLNWMCEMAQIVKDAAKSSSDAPNRTVDGLKVELHVPESVASTCPVLVKMAVKDLERLAGSGNVSVVEDD